MIVKQIAQKASETDVGKTSSASNKLDKWRYGIQSNPSSDVSTSTFRIHLEVAGKARTALLHIPLETSAISTATPALNHSSAASNAEEQLRMSGMNQVADAHGFIVVYPQADIPFGPSGFAWNIPGQPLISGLAVPSGASDDTLFIRLLITALVGTHDTSKPESIVNSTIVSPSGRTEQSAYSSSTSLTPLSQDNSASYSAWSTETGHVLVPYVDPLRVYVTGFSGGARMACQLACDLPNMITAIAAVSGIRFPSPCRSQQSTPIIAFHGTLDEVDLYKGGGQAYWTYSVPQAAQMWAAHNLCQPDLRNKSSSVNSVDIRLGSNLVQTTFIGCSHTNSQQQPPLSSGIWRSCQGSRKDVMLYTIEDGGHDWPGATASPGSTFLSRLSIAQSVRDAVSKVLKMEASDSEAQVPEDSRNCEQLTMASASINKSGVVDTPANSTSIDSPLIGGTAQHAGSRPANNCDKKVIQPNYICNHSKSILAQSGESDQLLVNGSAVMAQDRADEKLTPVASPNFPDPLMLKHEHLKASDLIWNFFQSHCKTI
ncbi:hypothetical protein CEUSTIGMA_g4354.t1 [Chlamydomonas eustigma]|uniref:Feruloyl esterase n=1 Tax=Chlamydomonas eustigma TaxID=1157962 RepID=A0A250X1G3_9CHLO|nr:hypothetical protein CEUSTIGMA_g4354.t1 [Chlamydomonas eustigma]|eukprot:GAX76908.1 hypothetical protein CEUSTIGMA_g4354.t1 [Chlamydomonas eustigma]